MLSFHALTIMGLNLWQFLTLKRPCQRRMREGPMILIADRLFYYS